MGLRSIQDAWLNMGQLPFIHILTWNLLLKVSQQAVGKRSCLGLELSLAQRGQNADDWVIEMGEMSVPFK